jgi:hypothetical protein
MSAQRVEGGVRNEDRPALPSSFSEARAPAVGGAAGASTAILSTVQFISEMMRLIPAATPRAASRNGDAEFISLLPTPRGMSAAISFGIRRGIIGGPAETTQIGNALPRAHARSMPM